MAANNSDEKKQNMLAGDSASGHSSFGSDPLINKILADRYQILSLIGSGGWGNVYKATHLVLKKLVAIKVLHEHHQQDAAGLRRLEKEARALSRIENMHVVQVLDFQWSPVPFIAMEYFDGMPLSKGLRENGKLAPDIAIELFLQVADALKSANGLGIVHRDLKPANILLRFKKGRVQAKVLDFGLAKSLEEGMVSEKLTATGELLGSPAYMSPEQWSGRCEHRSDLYALGCIMYEVLAGVPAFSAKFGVDYMNKHLKDYPPKFKELDAKMVLPTGLESVVRKCLQKDPVNRYHTASALIVDLQKIREGKDPHIVLDEEKTIRGTKHLIPFVLTGTAVALILSLCAFCFKQELLQSYCNYVLKEADSELQKGATDDATGHYRTALNLSPQLKSPEEVQRHSLRKLVLLADMNKESLASRALQKRYLPMIGSVDTMPNLMLILERSEQCKEKGDLPLARKLALEAMELAHHTAPGGFAEAQCATALGDMVFLLKDYSFAKKCYEMSEEISSKYFDSGTVFLDEERQALVKVRGALELASAQERVTKQKKSREIEERAKSVEGAKLQLAMERKDKLEKTASSVDASDYRFSNENTRKSDEYQSTRFVNDSFAKLLRERNYTGAENRNEVDAIKERMKMGESAADLRQDWIRLGELYYGYAARDSSYYKAADLCYSKGIARERYSNYDLSMDVKTHIVRTKRVLRKTDEANKLAEDWF